MIDGWACEKDWMFYENRSYVESVQEAGKEFKAYKSTKKYKEHLRNTMSLRI